MKSAFNIFRSDYTLILRKRPMRKTQYEILQGNAYDLLVQRDEFRSLWAQFPEQRFIHSTGQRVLHLHPFAFYEEQFGYDYLLLFRHAIDEGDYLVLTVEMLVFLAILRSVHNPEEATQVKHDLVLLLQKLGVPLFPS
jgi:hypothetical protein